MNIEEFVKSCMEKLNEEMLEMKHVNIIVAGKTGVGKSTLINSVFREKLAETGIGEPVTKNIKELVKPDFPLRIYDTVGLEMGSEKLEKTKSDIYALIKYSLNSGNTDKFIHCIWYCVSVDSNRFEEEEERFIDALAEENAKFGVPVIIVLTLCHNLRKTRQMMAFIENKGLLMKGIFPVLAEDYEDEDFLRKAYGGQDLVEFTASILPEAAQKSFINAQCASLDLKRKKAKAVIRATAATTFAEGYMPLPFSDATAIIPTQIGMIASITAIYGIPMNQAVMTSLVTSLLGVAGTTFAGRSIASNLLKLLPGVGTAIGGTLSGATATLLTTALGETYIFIMDMLSKGEITAQELSDKSMIDKIQQVLKDKLKIKQNK